MSAAAPRWLVVATLSLCGVVSSLQLTLLIPLLPSLPLLLGVSAEDSSWLVTSTLVAAAVATPIVTRMADMYGKRRMLVISLSVMVLGSLICVLISTYPALLIGRAMQGFAAGLTAVGMSILRDELPPARVPGAVALMSATLGIGGALGLPLSGILTDSLGWKSIFWFSAITSVLLITALSLVVPRGPRRPREPFDLVGAVLLSLILVCVLVPITKGHTWGWSSATVLGMWAIAAVSTAVWVPWELRRPAPMVDLRTAARRPVLLTNLASAFVGASMFVNVLITSQILQQPTVTGYGLGLSVAATGWAMVPSGLMMVLISPFNGALLSRVGGRPVLMLGCAIMASAYVLRVFFSEDVFQVVLGSVLVGVGTATAFAAMPTLIMSSVPITETAAANGVNTLVRSLGTSIGSAVVALVTTALVIEVGAVELPSSQAIDAVLWMAAGSCIVAAAITWWVPKNTRMAEG